MPVFPKNPQRLTPYANFRFRVKWDNNFVAGVSMVSGLTRSTQVLQNREGGGPPPIHLAPSQTSYGPITLERGVSYDATFAQWANKVFDWTNTGTATGQNTSLLDSRKDIVIEIYDEAGLKVMAYNVRRCWVSEFHGMQDLAGVGNALVVQSLVLQNEGWERKDAPSGQAEPAFVLPARGPQA